MLRINTYTGDANGLKFPMLMTTKSLDLKQQYGDHAIYDYNLNGEFDEQRMVKPENAVVDNSKDVRQQCRTCQRGVRSYGNDCNAFLSWPQN